MKIITINVNKGGAGKTTLAHNFAEYLARDYRVLLLDFDDSSNLTNRYGSRETERNTVVELFETGKVYPIPIKDNLDIIAGSRDVEGLKERLTSKRRREYIFGKWLGENYSKLKQDYEYLVIDTENDEGILTVNALLVSDMILGIAEASKDSVTALARLKEFVQDINSDFDCNLHLSFVANKINLSEKASNDLLIALADYPEYLGYLPRRTSLANETSIFTLPKVQDTATFEQVSELFSKIKIRLDKEVD
jgi:chromosome partitioning protein